ncbi:MAG: hypothetical protein ACO3GP_03220 [Candidatus Limnocylindrus sp.]
MSPDTLIAQSVGFNNAARIDAAFDPIKDAYKGNTESLPNKKSIELRALLSMYLSSFFSFDVILLAASLIA